ncbi:6-phosphogluconolactonase [Chlorobium phaeovibrioides]|uniref:6-phosphogluconolactonase n=1 Tax=Chlorobium phaeovibrioides TaxID=1094 RepID=UPI000F81EFB5|nr:6-phosphogluconolactonase [Chlorobium phaeovibrioides]QEQ57434.1 6-phosphogluconolactonase [Chlorobium phaeovibrioides]RTY36062.1 6-phosphogluconolactonase [Chlorobium phaeovibrioides]
MKPQHLCETEKELTRRTAALIIQAAWQAASKQGHCTIALAGGNSPRPLYRMISGGLPPDLFTRLNLPLPAAVPHGEATVSLPWRQCIFFWGDERCVPPDDARSNYRMADEELFCGKSPEELTMFRMHGESSPPEAGAEAYEAELRQLFINEKKGSDSSYPVFDLILLGLGPDGHTASLFPDNPAALAETEQWVQAVKAPDMEPKVMRLTLSLPVLNHAETVVFYSPGKEKAALAASIERGERPDLPAGMVKALKGRVVWLYPHP